MSTFKVTHYNTMTGVDRVEIVEAETAVLALAQGCNKVILMANGYTWKGAPDCTDNAHTQRRDGRIGSYAELA